MLDAQNKTILELLHRVTGRKYDFVKLSYNDSKTGLKISKELFILSGLDVSLEHNQNGNLYLIIGQDRINYMTFISMGPYIGIEKDLLLHTMGNIDSKIAQLYHALAILMKYNKEPDISAFTNQEVVAFVQ